LLSKKIFVTASCHEAGAAALLFDFKMFVQGVGRWPLVHPAYSVEDGGAKIEETDGTKAHRQE